MRHLREQAPHYHLTDALRHALLHLGSDGYVLYQAWNL
jgi:hypothetical protein